MLKCFLVYPGKQAGNMFMFLSTHDLKHLERDLHLLMKELVFLSMHEVKMKTCVLDHFEVSFKEMTCLDNFYPLKFAIFFGY